jgi:nucleotide-binding universal stress UspA family protein
MIRKILVCLDGSELAEEILPYILESSPPPGSEVVLLHVTAASITIPPPESTHILTLGRDFKPVKVPAADIGKTDTLEPQAGLQLKNIEKEQGDAVQYLKKNAQRFRTFRSKGIEVRTVVLEGNAGETILNYAENNKVNLIALTTHGGGGARGGILGRVAQFMLKESKIPVLIVKPGGRVS